MRKKENSVDTFHAKSQKDVATDFSFWKKFFTYFTLGLLWSVTVFGLLFTPVILIFGSTQSYMRALVNASTWSYSYVLIVLYTVIISFYLGTKGYRAKLPILIFLNILVLVFFIAATFISISIVFE
ncbi:MAG: hypothetical protein WC505_02810 [Patescibacteria group bacterium]